MYKNGAEDQEVYKTLGIAKTSFYKYLKQHNELAELKNKAIDNKIDESIKATNQKLENAIPLVEAIDILNDRFRDPTSTVQDLIALLKVLHPDTVDWYRQMKWYEAKTKRMQSEKDQITFNNNIGVGDDIIKMLEGSVQSLEDYNENESEQ